MKGSKLGKSVAALVAGGWVLSAGSGEAALTYSSLFTVNNLGGGSNMVESSSISIGDQFEISFVVDETQQAFFSATTPGARQLDFDNVLSDLEVSAVAGNTGGFAPSVDGASPYFRVYEAGGKANIEFSFWVNSSSSITYDDEFLGSTDAGLYWVGLNFETSQDWDSSWAVGTTVSEAFGTPTTTWTSTNVYFAFESIFFRPENPAVGGIATISPVPEPGSAALMLLCGAGALVRRRR